MRGRRGASSSSVYGQPARMALRKHRIDENTQEDEAVDDRDDEDEFSSSLLPAASAKDKRRRERENKSKPKQMTEEEMMDLALHLSKQEASITASILQQEEEAMMKAMQESMVSQTQPCPHSQSQSLLADAEASLRLSSRRKLLYVDRKTTSAINQGAIQNDCSPGTDLNQVAKATGDENIYRNKRRKRKEGSPLLEMPDLSQTQKIYSQTSPCSSESLSVPLDSPQSSDSTQIDDCQLHKSPVFPLTGRRAEVHVPRLSQDLLETCKTSGFVLCSQDSWTLTQKSQPAQPKSPTFPKRPTNLTSCSKSSVLSSTHQGDDGETELSPVFGRNTDCEYSPSACKPQVCENSGFMFSSQESVISSVRTTSCQPKSPVFPGTPNLPGNLPYLETRAISKSPVFSETDQGQTERTYSSSSSPVFAGTGRRQQDHPDVKKSSVVSSPAEVRSSNSEVNSPVITDPSQNQSQEDKTDRSQDGSINEITTSSKSVLGDIQELNDTFKGCNSTEMDLTSDIMLVWSDEEDDDVTLVGPASPVFPEERPLHQVESQAASMNHESEATPQLTSCRQQLSTTEQDPQPMSSQVEVSRALTPSEEPAGRPMVHYYWGVPFCPRGLDPDSYTQVILAQMEVYEKSLKQAQRCLLRKVEWGEPVLPQPEKSPPLESPAESPQHHIPQRHGLRLRGKRCCEAVDNSPAEAEEGEGQKEEEKEEGSDTKEDEINEGENSREGQMEIDDCEVCPETQLSDSDRTQDLTMATDDDGEQIQRESPELPEVEMILRDDSPAADQQQMEVDGQVDRKTKGSILMRKDATQEDERDQDVKEVKDGRLQRSASPELEPAAVPQSPEAQVDCPICQGSFPVTEIEIHAAYCDGEVAVVDQRRPEVDGFQTSLKSRRKRTKRADVTDEEANSHFNSDRNQEKCYICQKAVPLRDYSHHTEFCFQRRLSKSDAKGNLLSALEQTESRDSEPGPSRLQPGDVIDLRDDDEDEEDDGSSAFRISNSPIRSFTPISEATDCLIDFKKQQRAKKPSRRRQ